MVGALPACHNGGARGAEVLPQVSCRGGRCGKLLQISSPIKNRLALACAQDNAIVRANNSLSGRGSADEEVMLSINGLLEEEGGEGEEDNVVE